MTSILFEDNHLLIVHKEPGIVTVPCGTSDLSLLEICRNMLKKREQKEGNVFLQGVHQLDRPVSGVVVFAKSSKSLTRLNENIRQKKWQKIYYAIVHGVPPKAQNRLEHFLIHDKEAHKARVVKSNQAGSSCAILEYKIISRIKEFTLVEVQLETGRYHQIRAQLAHIGCPIVGDKKYGSSYASPSKQLFLHHYELTLIHPVLKTPLTVHDSLPDVEIWKQFTKYKS